MSTARKFPVAPAFSCLAGVLFCLWVLFSGGEELCLTNGCSLFQDFSLAGVSLWAAGSIFFASVFALCLLRAFRAARFLAAAALAADAVLMAVMAFTAPCVNCLVVGLLIALTFLVLQRSGLPHSHAGRSPLLLLWGLLFIVSTGGTARDLSGLWSPLPRDQQASMQIFFSPSCRACQVLTEQSGSLTDASWFPVAEDERDIWIIHAMTRRIEQGQPLREAVEKARNDVPGLAEAPDIMALPDYRFGLLKPDMLLLQFRLWKNRAHVLAAGSDRLPFVEYHGLPAFFRNDAPAGAPAVLPELNGSGVAGFCGGNKEKSCDDPADSVKNRAGSGGLIDTSGMAP